MRSIDYCYQELANAIIVQAAEDLRVVNKAIKKQKKRTIEPTYRLKCLERIRKRILDFFQSNTYRIFTKVPYEVIVSGIDAETS